MVKNDSKLKPKRRKAVFLIHAPEAKEVCMAGDFNEWMAKKHHLKKNADGVWGKITFLFPGRYEYKFIVDGKWELDPDNHRMCANRFGTHNNVITILAK